MFCVQRKIKVHLLVRGMFSREKPDADILERTAFNGCEIVFRRIPVVFYTSR